MECSAICNQPPPRRTLHPPPLAPPFPLRALHPRPPTHPQRTLHPHADQAVHHIRCRQPHCQLERHGALHRSAQGQAHARRQRAQHARPEPLGVHARQQRQLRKQAPPRALWVCLAPRGRGGRIQGGREGACVLVGLGRQCRDVAREEQPLGFTLNLKPYRDVAREEQPRRHTVQLVPRLWSAALAQGGCRLREVCKQVGVSRRKERRTLRAS